MGVDLYWTVGRAWVTVRDTVQVVSVVMVVTQGSSAGQTKGQYMDRRLQQ